MRPTDLIRCQISNTVSLKLAQRSLNVMCSKAVCEMTWPWLLIVCDSNYIQRDTSFTCKPFCLAFYGIKWWKKGVAHQGYLKWCEKHYAQEMALQVNCKSFNHSKSPCFTSGRKGLTPKRSYDHLKFFNAKQKKKKETLKNSASKFPKEQMEGTTSAQKQVEMSFELIMPKEYHPAPQIPCN